MSTNRRQEDLHKLQRLSEKSGNRIRILKQAVTSVLVIVELLYNTVPSDEYPSKTQDKSIAGDSAALVPIRMQQLQQRLYEAGYLIQISSIGSSLHWADRRSTEWLDDFCCGWSKSSRLIRR